MDSAHRALVHHRPEQLSRSSAFAGGIEMPGISIRRTSAEKVRDRGDAAVDGTLGEVAEVHHELWRVDGCVDPVMAHAEEADRPSLRPGQGLPVTGFPLIALVAAALTLVGGGIATVAAVRRRRG
jgi:hypothetical protein